MESNVRKSGKRKYFDYGLVFVVLFLLVFGLIMIYSTSYYNSSLENNGDGLFYLRKQAINTVIGLAFMTFTTFFPTKVYKKFASFAYVFGMVVALLVLTPLGHSANGATRWIKIAGVSLQVAEVIKITTIISVAAMLDKMTTKERRSWKGLVFTLGPTAIAAVYIWRVTNDLSSAAIIGGIAFVMLVLSDKKVYKPYIVLAGGLVAGGLLLLAIIKGWGGFGFRGERILAWLNPEGYADSSGFQTLQALYGIGSGGVFGKGLGKSMQKLNFLPEAQNDMIFSIICEELGLFGGIAIMLMFALLLWRIYDVVSLSNKYFDNLLCIGVFAQIAIQVVLNIAVVTNTIPNTGISLPFISFGGSSVIFLLGEIGLVLNLSRRVDLREVAEDEALAKQEKARKKKKKRAVENEQ